MRDNYRCLSTYFHFATKIGKLREYQSTQSRQNDLNSVSTKGENCCRKMAARIRKVFLHIIVTRVLCQSSSLCGRLAVRSTAYKRCIDTIGFEVTQNHHGIEIFVKARAPFRNISDLCLIMISRNVSFKFESNQNHLMIRQISSFENSDQDIKTQRFHSIGTVQFLRLWRAFQRNF